MSLLDRLKDVFTIEPEHDDSRDVGPAVVDAVFKMMQIDAQWSRRADREFTWWGHRLAQRVWAERPREVRDRTVSRVWARTSILRDVPDRPETYSAIAEFNVLSAMSALVYDPKSKHVFLNCGMIAHGRNRAWLEHFFGMAVALQASQAEMLADDIAVRVGGAPAASAHPDNGPRREPDDMLNMMGVEAHHAKNPATWFTAADFQSLVDMKPNPWLVATADEGALTGELPFINDVPTAAAMMPGYEGEPPGTALVTLSTREPHPFIGAGLLARAGIPVPCDPVMANTLNLLETSGPWETPQLGAWCDEGWHASFLPGSLLEAASSEARHGHLVNAVMAQVLRVQGMREHLRRVAGPPTTPVRETGPVADRAKGAGKPSTRSAPGTPQKAPEAAAPARRKPPKVSASRSATPDTTASTHTSPTSSTGEKGEDMAFNWTNITRGICRDLAREAGMRVSKAEEDLRNRYGEPPNEELVNELWPVLRDRWLGTQPRWRELVIDELRKAKLGDMSLRLSTKTGQMAYLKSCRLSTRLRSAVLEAFVAAGANPMNPPSIMVDTNDSAAPATREAQGRARTQQARRTPAGGELGAYLDQALEQILGEKPYIDEDGDFVIEFGSVVMYVHGEAPSDYIPTVRTFSTLVRDVKLSPSLLSDINEINVKLRFGKVIVVEGGVGINATIPAVSLEINELHAILLEVSGAGDYYDTVLSEKHGGATIGRDAGDVIDA